MMRSGHMRATSKQLREPARTNENDWIRRRSIGPTDGNDWISTRNIRMTAMAGEAQEGRAEEA
jgi:hypothetical protein